MKAIIMAAGIGSRLENISGNRPKCLIEMDGISLISLASRRPGHH